MRELGLNPDDRRLSATLRLIGELIGFPPTFIASTWRPFIITQIQKNWRNRAVGMNCAPSKMPQWTRAPFIEWDKDEYRRVLGILKIDGP